VEEGNGEHSIVNTARMGCIYFKERFFMKKKICLFVLLIAVAVGMAFAQKVGDYLKFKQNSNEDDIRVLSVKKTKTGIVVEYQGIRSIKKAVFSARVTFTTKNKIRTNDGDVLVFGDNMATTVDNSEYFIKQGKIYTVNLKWDFYSGFDPTTDPIARVEIFIEGIPSPKEYSEPTDKPVPKQPKGSWIDRAFPPLKL
jgi:ribosomal protein L14